MPLVILIRAGGSCRGHSPVSPGRGFDTFRGFHSILRLGTIGQPLIRVLDQGIFMTVAKIHREAGSVDMPEASFADRGRIAVPVPAGVAGRWSRIVLRVPLWAESEDSNTVPSARFLVFAVFNLADGTAASDPVFLKNRATAFELLAADIVYVPVGAVSIVVTLPGGAAPAGRATLAMKPSGQIGVVAALLAAHPKAMGKVALTGVTGRWRQARRVLSEVASLHAAGSHRRDYAFWIAACEYQLDPGIKKPEAVVTVIALIYGDPTSSAYAATERSLAEQSPPVPCLAASAGDVYLPPSLGPGAGYYIAVLQAGEVLAQGAIAGAAGELRRLDFPAIATSDYDQISADGVRSDPVLTPNPNHVLMLSGTMARGLWFIRADLLPRDPALSDSGLWAEPVRLAAWLHCFRADDPGRTIRLPFILSHRTTETGSAPADVMTRIVNAHLEDIDHGMRVEPGQVGALPVLRLVLAKPRRTRGFDGPRRGSSVSIVIPSTLTAKHFLPCLHQLLTLTPDPDVEIVVAAAQPGPLTEAQRRAADQAGRDGRVRVVHVPMPAFNFSAVNNRAAALTRHPSLLLLNDDVSPLEPGWLDHMLAHFDDPRIGIVGPRMFYPSGHVQHAGVVMGLGGMCDHPSRNLPADASDQEAWIALDREISAVTGACLLVRREAFMAVGGLDETYPSAFNDIDLCLRMGEAGWGKVYAGSVVLTHHELQTYGSHYAGERARHRSAEIARFRQRWADVVSVDPFDNPNLNLVPGPKRDLAMVPRIQQWRIIERSQGFNVRRSERTVDARKTAAVT